MASATSLEGCFLGEWNDGGHGIAEGEEERVEGCSLNVPIGFELRTGTDDKGRTDDGEKGRLVVDEVRWVVGAMVEETYNEGGESGVFLMSFDKIFLILDLDPLVHRIGFKVYVVDLSGLGGTSGGIIGTTFVDQCSATNNSSDVRPGTHFRPACIGMESFVVI